MQLNRGVLAIAWVVLLVRATVAPVTAVTDTASVTAGNDATTATADGAQPIGGDAQTGSGVAAAPPVVKKAEAVDVIDGIDAGRQGGHARHVSRAHDRINGTFGAYRDPVRQTTST